MQNPTEWTEKQLAVAVYVYRFDMADLGLGQGEVLRIMGLTKGQWEARLGMDFPALDGKPNAGVEASERLRETYAELKLAPREVLRTRVLSYLEAMRRRKGL